MPFILWDQTLATVAAGAGVLGLLSGTLGCYAVLRRQSLLGDAISHAALPGIALAFLLTGSKAPLVLIGGAAMAGFLGTLIVMSVVNRTRVKDDAALGIVLSVFFGFGLVLLTYLQKRPDASQAGLKTFLFGQAATLLQRDVQILAALTIVALAIVALLWKEFKIIAFDRDFARSAGFPVRGLETLLTALLTLAIVLGLQTVGVVLMSAMVVAPAAAARQWTDRLGFMVILAAAFGAFSGASGAVISSLVEKLPTGPTVVIVASIIVLVSLLAAPQRGVVWNWLRRRQNRRRLRLEAVLADLYELELQHAPGLPHGHPAASLEAMSYGQGGVHPSLRTLEERGQVYQVDNGRWALTEHGMDEARRVAEQEALLGGQNQ